VQAGTALVGRRLLAAFVAVMLMASVMLLFSGSPAQADHVDPDDEVANDGPAGTNDAPYWVNYLASVRGIDDATCTKINQASDDAWVMPAEPADRDWVLLVVKQGDTNFVYYDPVAGHTYPSEGPNAPGHSHILVCSVPEETTTTTVEDTTTTTVEDTTTTSVEDTTTTTVEDTTTTTVEDTTTTTIEDEVLPTVITTSTTAAPTTTVEDEVLAEELPLTGVNTDLLALLAGGLGLMGALVLAATRRIEDN
jgi:LPXTG-motif cell wall-anchored protein